MFSRRKVLFCAIKETSKTMSLNMKCHSLGLGSFYNPLYPLIFLKTKSVLLLTVTDLKKFYTVCIAFKGKGCP